MAMTGKSALYALAVAVLMGTMAVAAMADYSWEAGAVKPDAAVSSQPAQDMYYHSDSGEIREPVETGSIPDRMEGAADLFRLDTGEAPVVDFGGQSFRPSIDTGP